MSSAWAGVAVGLIAAMPAYVGIGAVWVKAGVADGRAQRAEERAEGALEAYQRMADALDRISEGRGGGQASVDGPPVSFTVEWRGGSSYSLRNLGPETATGVTIDGGSLPIGVKLPTGATLEPLEAVGFGIVGRLGMPSVAQVRVTTAELPDPVMVPIPPTF